MGNRMSFDPDLEKASKFMMCKCGQRAVYRCQYSSPMQLPNNYPPRQHELGRYYLSCSLGGPTEWIKDNYIYKYISCQKCMDLNDKWAFTHHSKGWKEHYKILTNYEPMNQRHCQV